MSGGLVRRGRGAPGALTPAGLAREAAANEAAATNPRTAAVYETQMRSLAAWAEQSGAQLALPLPPMLVVAYVAHMSARQLSPATVGCALWAIGRWHKAAGLPSPTASVHVARARQGYRQRWLEAGHRQRRVAAITVEQLRRMVTLPPARHPLRELRDRAILLLAVALAARRSELVALRADDVRLHGELGLRVYLARSKTDQLGEGAWLAVPRATEPLCADRAVRAWMAAARPTRALFCPVHRYGQLDRNFGLNSRVVANVVKDLARRLGDPNLSPDDVSGHSPRATLVTVLLGRGADAVSIAQHTRHRSLETLRRYDRGEAGFGETSVLHKLFLEDP